MSSCETDYKLVSHRVITLINNIEGCRVSSLARTHTNMHARTHTQFWHYRLYIVSNRVLLQKPVREQEEQKGKWSSNYRKETDERNIVSCRICLSSWLSQFAKPHWRYFSISDFFSFHQKNWKSQCGESSITAQRQIQFHVSSHFHLRITFVLKFNALVGMLFSAGDGSKGARRAGIAMPKEQLKIQSTAFNFCKDRRSEK